MALNAAIPGIACVEVVRGGNGRSIADEDYDHV